MLTQEEQDKINSFLKETDLDKNKTVIKNQIINADHEMRILHEDIEKLKELLRQKQIKHHSLSSQIEGYLNLILQFDRD